MKTLIVVSGYFNPVHIGHINLFKSAKEMGDMLLVIVNNDKQQMLKKGTIIMSEEERLEIVRSIKYVDEVFLAIDEDATIRKSLVEVAAKYPDRRIIFGNGGDRKTDKEVPETQVCKKYGIEMRFGVGGMDKPNSSSNINRLRGLE